MSAAIASAQASASSTSTSSPTGTQFLQAVGTAETGLPFEVRAAVRLDEHIVEGHPDVEQL